MTKQNQVVKKEQLNFPTVGNAGAGELVASAREMQEVQAQAVLAKRFPRDEAKVLEKLQAEAGRTTLIEANRAFYRYKQGRQTIVGMTIRVAEILARCWGNISCGVKEIGETKGGKQLEAYCWDLETNFRRSISFDVENVIYSRVDSERPELGYNKRKLETPAEKYNNLANYGARRLRTCIFSVIPVHFLDRIEKILKKVEKEHLEMIPIPDQIKEILAFFEMMNVNKKTLEQHLGKALEKCTPEDTANLYQIRNSLKGGHSTLQDWFPEMATPTQASPLQNKVNNMIAKNAEKERQAAMKNQQGE